MASSHFCLSNDTYKNHVLEGFSRFQQSDEFVDMTLAAEGCLVKVHQSIIALASPFLKQLIKSVPCQHPVLFLNNVSHELLSFVLEYIYTGEVKLPDEKIPSFLKVAQAMCLKGLDNITLPNMENNFNVAEAKDVYHDPRPTAVANCGTIENDCNLQRSPKVESLNIEDFVEQSTSIPMPVDVPKSEGNQFVGIIDLSTAMTHNSVTINIGNSGRTSLKIKETDTDNFKTSITDNDNLDTENVPIIFQQQLSELATPFLNTDNSANTAGSDITNQNNVTNDNNSTDFSNIFNISNEMPLSHDNDLAADISISDLLDCNKVATPSTINDTENVDNIQTENVEIMQTENVNNYQTENVENMQTENVDNIQTENVDNIQTENDKIIETANVVSIEIGDVDFDSKGAESVLYTISNRGYPQMIMNRFMYYTHYQAYSGRRRRWRCIDYREKHCHASIDTDNGVLIKRQHKHCHPNHDKQIWNRAIKNKIFCTLNAVEKIIIERKKNTCNETVVLADTDDK